MVYRISIVSLYPSFISSTTYCCVFLWVLQIYEFYKLLYILFLNILFCLVALLLLFVLFPLLKFVCLFLDVEQCNSLYWICYNIVFVFCFGLWRQGMWDLSSLIRDLANPYPCIESWSLNHWTTRKVLPVVAVLNEIFSHYV